MILSVSSCSSVIVDSAEEQSTGATSSETPAAEEAIDPSRPETQLPTSEPQSPDAKREEAPAPTPVDREDQSDAEDSLLDEDDWTMADLRASADPSEIAGPECEELMAETLRLWALGDADREVLLEPFTPEGQAIMGDLIDFVTVEGMSPLEAKSAMGNALYPNICK